ncbi:MAG: tetratricopeptide repeat protein [Acidobacteriota bacterium]
MLILILFFSFLVNPFALQSEARFALRGYVRTASGQALGNVRVSLLDENRQTLKTIFSDSTGKYEFRTISRGVYFLRVDMMNTNYENVEQRIELVPLSVTRSEEPVMIDLTVKPKKNAAQGAPPAINFSQSVPDAAQKEYKRGMDNLRARLVEQGVVALKKAIEIFPDYYDALEQLGNFYVEQRDYQNAQPLLLRAVEVNRDGWRAHYGLGIAQFNLHQREQAVNSLRRAVELNAGSVNAYMWLGIVLAQQSDTRMDAIQAFERVVQMAKDDVPDAYFYLGSLYSRNNQYKEAADALEHFLRIAPQVNDKEKIKKLIEQLRQKAKS